MVYYLAEYYQRKLRILKILKGLSLDWCDCIFNLILSLINLFSCLSMLEYSNWNKKMNDLISRVGKDIK